LDINRNIVIIGCGAGGGTAAQFARKTDRKSTITIFEKGNYPQYSKCGLPHAISGIIPMIDDLVEFSEDWFKKANIDLLLETSVEKIDVKEKIVYASKNGNVIEKSYTSMIIASGAIPTIPPIKNIYENDILVKGCFTVRTLNDAKNITSFIEKGKNATVIGAGLIGLEMADSLIQKGMNVTVIEALPQILPNTLDVDMAKIVYDKLSENITIFTNCLAIRTENDSRIIKKLVIKNNESGQEKEIPTDLLIIATGIKPETDIAEQAGCKLSEKGYIIVNNASETSIKDIYAVGDCTEFIDFVTKKPIPIGLGSIGVRQGISAGINAAGGNYLLPDGVLKTCTSEFFNLEIAAVGISGKNFISGRYNGSSLPDYFPGGKPISIKVFADENGKIMGAQIVGDKAAKRIDTFACAILAGLNIETFRKLETAYAPSIAPTLDAETLVCDIISMKLARRR
jgi:NADH oxidase (H2O2-forming)